MTSRSLQVQQQGIEVAGNNLANVNNPAYARQRLQINTSTSVQSQNGLIEGTGAEVSGIQQIRNAVLDAQMVTENGVTGSLEAQQEALQYAQSDLGQTIDSGAAGAEGAAAASVSGGQHAIGDAINNLFNSFQSLSTQPSSITERDIVLNNAAQVADRFQETDKRLEALNSSLNDGVVADVGQVNSLLTGIAQINQQITRAEATGGVANDLRDARQAKLEDLGKLVKFDATDGGGGAVNISIGGVTMVDATSVSDQLETYDAGGGKTMVRSANTDAPLDITSGHINGLIDARETGALGSVDADLELRLVHVARDVLDLHQLEQGDRGEHDAEAEEGRRPPVGHGEAE